MKEYTILQLPPEHKKAMRLLFPRLFGSIAHIDLDALLQKEGPKKITFHNHPEIKQKVIDRFHAEYSLAGSYGGWMENRQFMWKGSYLDEGNKHIHLGIDCNLPAKTPVAFPLHAQVIYTRTDPSTEIGWGTYICLQTEKYVYTLGHLSPDIKIKLGDTVKPNDLIGSIGTYPENGNVFEHLHIQATTRNAFEKIRPTIEKSLDGYGYFRQRRQLRIAHPNPLNAICEEMGGVDEMHPKECYVETERWRTFYS